MLNEQDQPAQADQGTPEEQDASKRMELAALQLLYDKKTHPGIMKLYKSASDDPQQAVSEVTLKIMSILREKAKGVPESTVIPTALKIMMYVTELGEVSGTIDPLDEQGLQETMRLVTQGLLQMYGVPQDELAAKMQGMQGQQMQPGGQPMATQQPPQAPHPGVVNGAMQPPGGA
jgi:hypothetical protein